jgi:Asp-tRNA(Asn)/Glu-tRNA(Gln) amidotransferase A subunit family amidase
VTAPEDIAGHSVTRTLRELRQGRYSVRDRVAAALGRIRARDAGIRAFVDLDPDAVQCAEALDADAAARSLPLFGVPVAVKETFDVRGLRCAWGSDLHRDRRPEDDAEAVARLRRAGAVVIGTTVSTEYALGGAGPTCNPHDSGRTPGGSSSGSAAAVAAGLVPLALGSQSIGSIVRPALYCGVPGLKAGRDTVDLRGLMPLSPYLDQFGLFARTVDDLAVADRALRDPGMGEEPAEATRVLLIRDPYPECVDAAGERALETACAAFENQGLPVVETPLDADFRRAADLLETILLHDLARLHGDRYRRLGGGMSERLRGFFERGLGVSAEDCRRARGEAEALAASLQALMSGPSIVLAPATDGVAPPMDRDGSTGSNRLQGLWTLMGLPTVAVPCDRSEGLPVGVQLVAGPGCEPALMQTARALERATAAA